METQPLFFYHIREKHNFYYGKRYIEDMNGGNNMAIIGLILVLIGCALIFKGGSEK